MKAPEHITPKDILRDKDVAKLAGLETDRFQRKMKKAERGGRGFAVGELYWPAAMPVPCGRERVWLREDVERVWRERICVVSYGEDNVPVVASRSSAA